jgi:hypothetical protein
MIDDELWEKLQGLLPRYCSHELKNRVKIVNLHRYREDREMNAHRRHDLSNQTWALLEQHALSFYPLERQRHLGRFTRKNCAIA